MSFFRTTQIRLRKTSEKNENNKLKMSKSQSQFLKHNRTLTLHDEMNKFNLIKSPSTSQFVFHSSIIKPSSPSLKNNEMIQSITATNTNHPALLAFYSFMSKSLLQSNHEDLISILKNTSKEVINQLNLNHLIIQSTDIQNLNQNHSSFIFNCFSNLKQLDEEILKVLVTSIDEFRPDFFRNTLDCLSDTITIAIRNISTVDYHIAIFIESLWKFFVILFDISTQWSLNRCKNLVQEQVKYTLKELAEAKRDFQGFQDQMILKLKGNQYMLENEQKNYQLLKEKYDILVFEHNDLKNKCAEIENFEKAEGFMQQLALKIRELDQTLKTADKQIIDHRLEITKQINEFANSFLKKKNEIKPLYRSLTMQFNPLQENMQFDLDILTAHPFNSFYLVKLLSHSNYISIDLNFQYELQCFFNYVLANSRDLTNHNYNCSRLFVNWCGNEDFQKAIQILEWVSDNNSSFAEIFQNLFGMKQKFAISNTSLNQLIAVCKQIKSFQSDEIKILKNENFQFNFEELEYLPLIGELRNQKDNDYHTQTIESWLPTNLQGKLINQYSTNMTVNYFLNLVIKLLSRQEDESWHYRKQMWKEKIFEQGIHQNWYDVNGYDQMDEKAVIDQYQLTFQIWSYTLSRYALKHPEKFQSQVGIVRKISRFGRQQTVDYENYKIELSKFLEETFSLLRILNLCQPRLFSRCEKQDESPLNNNNEEQLRKISLNTANSSNTAQKRKQSLLTQKIDPLLRKQTTPLRKIDEVVNSPARKKT